MDSSNLSEILRVSYNCNFFIFLAIAIIISLVAIYLISLIIGAVNSISESDAQICKHRSDNHSSRIYKLYKQKERVKATMSSVESIFSILFAVVATYLFLYSFNYWNFQDNFSVISAGTLFFVIVTFFIVIAAVIPWKLRSLKKKSNITPFMSATALNTYKLFSKFALSKAYSNSTDDDTSQQISVAINSDTPQVGDKEMLRNILQFGDIEVREIMTPRHDIVAVENSDGFTVLKNKIIESNFSRIPVFEENTDNIYGIIYVKDLTRYISEDDNFQWTTLIRNIKYVPENMKISDLLNEFQQQKTHMAAVCDEYGGISGLITMQDILEKIVGEINDEFDDDDESSLIKKYSENHYLIDGHASLDDVCRELKLESGYFDKEKGDAESLAGLLLEICGEFPELHKQLQYYNLLLSVESFNGRRIEKIDVIINISN